LNFWVEKVEGTSPNRIAYCWVKISDNLDNNVDIYCYYGNSEATNASDGDNTFIFFDDFENTTDFNQGSLSISFTTTDVKTGNYAIKAEGNQSYKTKTIDQNSGRNRIFETWVMLKASSNTSLAGIQIAQPSTEANGYQFILDQRSSYKDIQIRKDHASEPLLASGSKQGELSEDIWYFLKVIWKDNGDLIFYVYNSDNSLFESINVNDGSYTDGHFGIFAYENAVFDTYRVRKYVSPEPSFSSSEQEEYVYSSSYSCDVCILKHQTSDYSVDICIVKEGWLPYNFRRQITIDNTSNSNNLADYQVKIVLNSSNFNFNHAKDDGTDIAFADSDGTTPLHFWREKWDKNNQEAILWVKVPSIPASSTKTIYLYYGSSNANDLSNGDNTFIFFDDFDGSDIDTNKWTFVQGSQGNGNYSVVNSILTWTHLPFGIKHTHDSLSHAALRARYYQLNPTSHGSGLYWWNGNNLIFKIWRDSYDKLAIYDTDGNEYDVGDNLTSWGILEFIKDQSDNLKINLNGSQQGSSYVNTYDLTSLNLGNRTQSNVYDTSDFKFDWILVRKYIDPEPSSTIGDEQTVKEINYSIDAILYGLKKTILVDSLLEGLNSLAYNIDVIIKKIEKLYNIDILLEKIQFLNYDVDILIKKLCYQYYNIDILLELLKSSIYTLDILIKELRQFGYGLDILLQKIVFNNYSIDLILSKVGQLQYSIDLILQKEEEVEFQYNLDILLRNVLNFAYQIDILLKSLKSIVWSIDVFLKQLRFTSYDVDSVFSELLSDSYNVDVLLKQLKSFIYNIDLLLKQLQFANYNIDSLLGQLQSFAYIIDIILEIIGKQISIDALFLQINEIRYSTDILLFQRLKFAPCKLTLDYSKYNLNLNYSKYNLNLDFQCNEFNLNFACQEES